MKIVHCSDLHLGKRFSGNKDYVKKRYMDFFNAFATFIDKVEEIKPDELERLRRENLRLKRQIDNGIVCIK